MCIRDRPCIIILSFSVSEFNPRAVIVVGASQDELNKTIKRTINLFFNILFIFSVVPGGGFEPPTRGFSVHCSTPELPGLINKYQLILDVI